ncbi:MAG: hypothetical protein Q7S39_10990 [Ignavibacteria bacterium]|nr:hypothetical protein [Ignavibacteria bacterium]
MSKILKKIFCLLILLVNLYSLSSFAQDLSEEQWNKNLEGKIIRNIIIKNLNVAESFDEKKNYADTSWFKNFTNSLHYKTRDWVVREKLLFEKGDKVDFRNLYESERLLRSTNLFLEVRINVYPIQSSRDEVDVEVITKDRWTLTYLAKYDPGHESGYFGLKDNNLIGLGHSADAVVTYNNDPSVGWGGRFRYTAPNFKGSYIDAGLKIEGNKKFSVKSLSLTRPFITYTKEWIGGIELKWEQNTIEIRDTSNTIVSRSLSRKSQDLWVGKAFPLNIENDLFKRNSNLITSVRVFSLNHTERPFDPFQYRIFENSTLLLFGAGVISRSYYKDRFVEDFGITEDIPVGGSVSLSTGPEKRELSNRWYIGLETIYSDWFDEYGYFSGRLGFGTFKNNSWEQNTFNLNLLYHSYLYRWKIWTYRLFARYDLLLGYNRISGEKTYLYSRTGLRGIDREIPEGTKKMVINTEARIFSPYTLLGFVIGGIAFVDFGLIADADRSFFSSRFYQAYGAGLRVKNESIINAAFELVFIFNPYHPQNKSAGFSVLLSTNFAIGIREIGYSKPFVEPF